MKKSVESGVPTFREAQTGLRAKYDPMELATPEAFQRNLKLDWEWYEWRRGLVAKAQPNPGHLALAKLEQLVPVLTLIPQNVDGLHQRAGNQNIVELHGNINRNKCFDEGNIIDSWTQTDEVPPRCPNCGGLLRPDVVWFGKSLPQEALAEAMLAAGEGDLFISVGTSVLVHPAASLPLLALQNNIPTVEINPSSTPITTQVTYALPGPSGEILPALVEALAN